MFCCKERCAFCLGCSNDDVVRGDLFDGLDNRDYFAGFDVGILWVKQTSLAVRRGLNFTLNISFD